MGQKLKRADNGPKYSPLAKPNLASLWVFWFFKLNLNTIQFVANEIHLLDLPINKGDQLTNAKKLHTDCTKLTKFRKKKWDRVTSNSRSCGLYQSICKYSLVCHPLSLVLYLTKMMITEVVLILVVPHPGIVSSWMTIFSLGRPNDSYSISFQC